MLIVRLIWGYKWCVYYLLDLFTDGFGLSR